MLLLLQNRGKLTTTQLAEELEVAKRTVLRDVEALEEAGLPVVVHRGVRGGIELGFNYRTRLTGLSHDEAEALGVLLAHPLDALEQLGLLEAGRRARSKLLESLPDGVRETALVATERFRFESSRREADPRIAALAEAVRERRQVRLDANSRQPRLIHPTALMAGARGWSVVDAREPKRPIPMREWGDVNISAHRF